MTVQIHLPAYHVCFSVRMHYTGHAHSKFVYLFVTEPFFCISIVKLVLSLAHGPLCS